MEDVAHLRQGAVWVSGLEDLVIRPEMREIKRAQSPEEAQPERLEEDADDMDQKRAQAASGINTGTYPTTADDGPGAGLPPSANEPGGANSTFTTPRTGTGETHHAAKGKKRSSKGDDDGRHEFEPGEDREGKRSTGASFSEATWGSGQAQALSALSSEAERRTWRLSARRIRARSL